LVQFLGSLGIERLGSRRVELMVLAAAGELDTLDAWRSGKLRDPAFAQRVGVPSVGSALADTIDAQASVIDGLLAAGVEIVGTGASQAAAGDSAEQGSQSLCITGKLPSGKKKADYAAELERVGIRLVDDVKEGLDFLVLADPASESAKAQKARKLGVRLLSEPELEQLIQA
jgi:NAD-dependent DNA ligase